VLSAPSPLQHDYSAGGTETYSNTSRCRLVIKQALVIQDTLCHHVLALHWRNFWTTTIELNFSAASAQRSCRRLAEQARHSPMHVLLLDRKNNNTSAHSGAPGISADVPLPFSNNIYSDTDLSRLLWSLDAPLSILELPWINDSCIQGLPRRDSEWPSSPVAGGDELQTLQEYWDRRTCWFETGLTSWSQAITKRRSRIVNRRAYGPTG
jgi:hypothetical protein